DKNGVNALMLAAMTSDNGHLCSDLLDYKSKVILQHKVTGDTALHIAVRRGCDHYVKHFLQKLKFREELVVIHNMQNVEKKTPLQIAENLQSDKKEILIALLEKYSGQEKVSFSESFC